MSRLIPLSLLLLATTAHAERALERVCFTDQAEATRAIPILNTVLVKGQDEIRPDGACLDVLVAPSRGELFLRWMRTRLPGARLAFTTLEAPRPPCEMVVTKTTRRERATVAGAAAPGTVVIAQSAEDGGTQEQSFLTVLSGGTAQLTTESGELSITCTAKGGGNYHLVFRLKPAAPASPPVLAPAGGAEVVRPSPPQEASSLSTEVDTAAGLEVNVGQILRELGGRQGSMTFPGGIQGEKTEGQESVKWVLKVQ